MDAFSYNFHAGGPRTLSKCLSTHDERICLPPKPRRAQSATARLGHTCKTIQKKFGNESTQAAILSKCKQRPASASVLQKTSEPTTRHHEFQPVVYGYKSGRRMSGGEELLWRQEDSVTHSHYPYRLANHQGDTLENEEEDSLSDLIDYDEDEIDLPRSLRPLAPWMSPHVSENLIGTDPAQCFVFLPCVNGMVPEDLPIVPAPPTDPRQELPYQEKIPAPKKHTVKKYDHPSLKRKESGDWTCEHTVSNTPSVLRIYSRDGFLLHESSASRTSSVVRKEIKELEDLMKGIGAIDGCSIIVQYQAEINQMQNQLRQLAGRLQEIDRREAARQKEEEPSDYCGLRAFYRDHEEVMGQIKRQHGLCIKELAAIESGMGIKTDRTLFKKQLLSRQVKSLTTACIDLK